MIARALLAVALLAATAATAHADAALPPPPSKKDATWQAKRTTKPLRAIDRAKLVGKKPGAVVSLYNTWTHEWIAVDARAKALPEELLDRFLRCHFTNEPTAMDARLAKVLLDAARHFKATRINIVSGFRAPKYNLMLRKKGRRVAKDSEHTRGHAVDFWLPDVPTERLYEWALRNAIGGVGKYISDGFVHMDVGRRRSWVDP